MRALCEALLNVNVCAVDVAAAYVASASIDAAIEQVPEVEAVKVGVEELVLESVQPVAVPLLTA